MKSVDALIPIDTDHCQLCAGQLARWLMMPIDPIKNTRSQYTNAMRCVECNVGTVRPVPSACEVADFYRLDTYYTHGTSHIVDIPPTIAERILVKLAWHLDHSKHFSTKTVSGILPIGAKVVDLGCGDGRLIGELQQAGFDVIGVEPDVSAQEMPISNTVNIVQGTAEDLPTGLTPGTFDLVVMSHSLEHCRDPGRTINNAAALLKPDGWLYCEVPNCSAKHFRTFTVTSTMFDAPRHLQFFGPANLKRLFEKRGFIVERRLFSGYTRQFQSSWRTWESTIWKRARLLEPGFPARRHSFARSIGLFISTAGASAEAKYDSVGLLARKAA